MQKMKTLGSIYISNLDPKIKERILELDVDKEKLKKFSDLEKFEKVSTLNDLKDLLTHTETEVLNTLNSLYNNSQFFTYCGPILVNINPGPGRVYDYLNLQKWMAESNKTDDARWKPHLYAYINYIYQTLCTEKKDQVVNLLGQIGSGKTFNLIHIIEYLTLLAGPENLQVELFDMIHKSIQLIHIMGSIYRQNNVESTCCGLLLKLSFDDDNKLCNFDIESKIVDFTLPFSENGRSYTILHALMCANSDLKKSLELPDSEQNLNFFKKFNKNFDAKTKEKFKMNDLEIWTRFHSLLNYFGFQKNEIFEILQLFSFIILLNECAIGRKKSDGCEEFFLNKSLITKKVAKNLNISEENLLIKIGVYKSINDLKSALIKLMKYTYFLIFEYIKSKVKRYSNKYFEILKEDSTINKTVNNLKSLYFIDIPSEIDDQTLGGLSTNLINECLNLFASNQYLSLVEKLEKEKINIKFIQPLHCVDVVNSLIGENGLGRLLSKKFNDKLFYKFKSYCNSIPHLRKTIEFSEPENLVEGTKPDQYIFRFKYSKKSVVYNLESLSLESRSMSFSKRLLNILELSNNKILKIVLKKDIKVNFLKPKTFFHFLNHTISEIFSPLQDLSPFLIYCFHSNNSLKIFFGETIDNKPNWNIPEKLTTDLCKHSLLMPVLYWEWFGYHEWISIDDFVDQFGVDFENIKDKLLLLAKAPKGRTKSAVSFNQLKKDEICLFILTILLGEKQFLLGQNYIMLKKGFLKDIRKILDNLAEIHKINRKTASIERRESKIDKKEDSKEIKSRKSVSNAKEEVSKKGIKSQMSLIKKKDSAQGIEPLNDIQKNVPLLKKNSLKILCHYKIINEKNDKGSREQPYYYNLFKFLVLPSPETILNNSIDGMNNVNEIKPKEDMKVVDDYINNNNVIVVNNLNTFNAFKNVLKADSNNYELFDYSDYIFEISKIQSCYRAFRARKRYKIFRYVIRKIILMQRYIRAWVIRSKLKRYISVTKKVTKIQKCYKKIMQKKIKSVLLLQKLYRKFIKKRKDKPELNILESENNKEDENGKLAFELFEVGNKEKEKRKNAKQPSLGKLDLDTSDARYKKDLDTNNDKALENLMDFEQKNFFDESVASLKIDKTKKPKKRVKGEKRIEDKLIDYGETLKKKKDELKLQKIKEEDSDLLFKPKTNIASKSNVKFEKTDFFNRMFFFKNKHEMKLEEMRNKKVDNRMIDHTFKPKISNIAQQLGKRTIEDLYNWKFRKEENLIKKIREKQNDEEKKIEEECSRKYRINSSSEIILQQKMERMSKIENSDENGDIDLWPVQMQKTYFEKK